MMNEQSNQGIIISGGTINAGQIAVGPNAKIQSNVPELPLPVTPFEDIPITKILILAANPEGVYPLRLDLEVRAITETLQQAQLRDHFIIEQKLAVRVKDLQRIMLETNPDIVHFSGHGLEEGLILENHIGKPQIVKNEVLAGLFELFENQVKCVILNACYSESQANAISQHIDYVIGMEQELDDKTAVEFAVGFYSALCTGRSYDEAFKYGCNAIRLADIAEYPTPILHTKIN